jgi:carboxymethylenebutenolidase
LGTRNKLHVQECDTSAVEAPPSRLTMEHCSDCGKGTLKVGDPKGVEIKLNNISVYQAKPLEESDKAILYLHDIAGWKFNNARLLADLLATETGCHVFIPDLFEGEIIRGGDFSFMEKAARKPQGIIDNIITKFHFVIAVPTIIQFVSKFPLKRVQPTLDSIIEEIKKMGISKIGTVGYCFGGKLVFALGQQKKVDCLVSVHPSPPSLPEGVEGISCPLLLICAEKDYLLSRQKADGIIKFARDSKSQAELRFYEGVSHGFAVRGNDDDPVCRQACQKATKETIDWFHQYLK